MRNRNMYNLTGLPGWMRFGYSPGWVGRSQSGLGPCAEFLASGQWPTPQMQQAWQGVQAAGMDELSLLKNQANILKQQLDQVQARIEELESD